MVLEAIRPGTARDSPAQTTRPTPRCAAAARDASPDPRRATTGSGARRGRGAPVALRARPQDVGRPEPRSRPRQPQRHRRRVGRALELQRGEGGDRHVPWGLHEQEPPDRCERVGGAQPAIHARRLRRPRGASTPGSGRSRTDPGSTFDRPLRAWSPAERSLDADRVWAWATGVRRVRSSARDRGREGARSPQPARRLRSRAMCAASAAATGTAVCAAAGDGGG